MGDFFCSYIIAKQITEIVIDLVTAAYRASAPGIGSVWAGKVLPLARRIIRR